MTDKKHYVKDPAEAAIPLLAALIASGQVKYDVEEIVEAHQKLAKALEKPKAPEVKISKEMLERANEKGR